MLFAKDRGRSMVFRLPSLQSPHILGAGALASILGIYHFASDNGLLGLVGYPRTATTAQVATSNGDVPGGVPTSYNNGYSTQTAPPNTYSPYSNAAPNVFNAAGDIRVLFSPNGGCTDAIVHEINQAQRQILIQAYSFTSKPIAEACVLARNRGVGVFAVLDKSQETEQYSAADFLTNSGIPTLIDSKHQIAHNKVILIDGRTVITGSFNFSASAEKSNAENLLIIHDRPDLYSAYEANIKHHYEHSTPHTPRGAVR